MSALMNFENYTKNPSAYIEINTRKFKVLENGHYLIVTSEIETLDIIEIIPLAKFS